MAEAPRFGPELLAALVPLLFLTSSGRLAGADDRQLERGLQALQSMAGCYLVDYSYVETESLKPGYVRDGRVYDVNRDKSVKEWIYPEMLSPRRIRLQRILFATDPAGRRETRQARSGIRRRIGSTALRSSTTSWRRSPGTSAISRPHPSSGRGGSPISTTASATSAPLADGRHSLSGVDVLELRAHPGAGDARHEPRGLPGARSHHAHHRVWLELARAAGQRQDHPSRGRARPPRPGKRARTGMCGCRMPSARPPRASRRPRQAFWALSRETWDSVLTGRTRFIEKVPPGQPPRFVKMYEVEHDSLDRDLADSAQRQAVRERILAVIQQYRAP